MYIARLVQCYCIYITSCQFKFVTQVYHTRSLTSYNQHMYSRFIPASQLRAALNNCYYHTAVVNLFYLENVMTSQPRFLATRSASYVAAPAATSSLARSDFVQELHRRSARGAWLKQRIRSVTRVLRATSPTPPPPLLV